MRPRLHFFYKLGDCKCSWLIFMEQSPIKMSKILCLNHDPRFRLILQLRRPIILFQTILMHQQFCISNYRPKVCCYFPIYSIHLWYQEVVDDLFKWLSQCSYSSSFNNKTLPVRAVPCSTVSSSTLYTQILAFHFSIFSLHLLSYSWIIFTRPTSVNYSVNTCCRTY